jgi:hypothetical protein
VSVSTCGGLIHGGGAYIRVGAYIRRFAVFAKGANTLSNEFFVQ